MIPGNRLFIERFQIAECFGVDNLTTARTGDWIDFRRAHAAVIFYNKGVGTNGQDPLFELKQAKDNSGTDAKALAILPGRAYKKQPSGANQTPRTVKKWTDASDDITSVGKIQHSDWGERGLYLAIEIRPEDLDEGFTHFQVNSGSVANTQYAAATAILDMGTHRTPLDMHSVLD